MKDVFLFNKKVGHITEDRRFVTLRHTGHYFIKYGGFGISTITLEELRKEFVQRIIIIYTRADNTQEAYKTTVDDYYQKGNYYTDRTADKQIILSTEHMKKVG